MENNNAIYSSNKERAKYQRLAGKGLIFIGILKTIISIWSHFTSNKYDVLPTSTTPDLRALIIYLAVGLLFVILGIVLIQKAKKLENK